MNKAIWIQSPSMQPAVEYYHGNSVLSIYLFLVEVPDLHLEEVEMIRDFHDMF